MSEFEGCSTAVDGGLASVHKEILKGRQSTRCAKAPKSQLTPAVRVLPLMSACM